MARQTATSGGGSFNSSITGPSIPHLRPEISHSYYSETVRLNKAIVCLLQEKLVHEFPQLKGTLICLFIHLRDMINSLLHSIPCFNVWFFFHPIHLNLRRFSFFIS
jgi:hypothetical protein